ncbi:MAG: CocE/NonD family hydrolase [Actinobacteria bacterium]|nr:CocE/NonD family hydrolase [Actinomycetota bacterium]
MARLRTLTTVALAAALGTSSLALAPGAGTPDAGDGVVVEVCSEHPAPQETTVTSRADGIAIDITVFRPCGATASSPVPVILHSHGWGGAKSTSGFGSELDAAFGVVSITQRGHGETGGQANTQNPELEAQDIKSVIDFVAALDWVRKDVDGEGVTIADDPVLFAMGGSYGGGYQTITALTEIRESGRTRFNALAPEITWYDLPRSLAPSGVARSLWNSVLYAAGVARIDMHPIIHQGFAWGSTTGQWPDGTVLGQPDPSGSVPDLDTFFHEHSPVAFVEQGHRIDVPVLWRQGSNDTLFPLNEGLDNFAYALTDEARQRSVFVSFNGGHTLPSAYPSLRNDPALGGSDVCSVDGFGALRLEFFRDVARGVDDPSRTLMARHRGLSRYNLMTDDGAGCIRLDALPERDTFELGQDIDNPAQPIDNGWMSTSGVGAATQVEIEGLAGPATVAGIPVLRGNVATIGVDQRMLFGISVGTSMADAQLVHAQVMPLRVVTPSPDISVPFELELGGITVTLAEGEKLFLTVTPVSEQFYSHGSVRTPGWMGFTDLAVDLPVVD